MTLEEARHRVANMVGDTVWPCTDDESLSDEEIPLDGRFSVDQLEAIILVMRADRAALNTPDAP
jgi:hypothetical protein